MGAIGPIAGAPAKGLLAVVAATAGAHDVTSTTSATLQDIDANLAITVTPTTTQVLLRVTAWATNSTGSCFLGFREGSTGVAGPARTIMQWGQEPVTYSCLITGLTPGVSHTYKFAFAGDGASGQLNIKWDGIYGPCLIEAWAA